jgi:prepilin-type N-terminal cleavage/methylation domain-containing protein
VARLIAVTFDQEQERIMKRHAGPRRRQAGFTIIEVLMVTVILAIAVTIAIPSFSRWLPGYRLRTAMRDLYGNIQLAKLSAIKSNQDCDINFYTSPKHRYEITLEKLVSGVTVVELVRGVTLSEYGSGVQFLGPGGQTFTVPTVTFNSRGLISTFSGVTNSVTAYYGYLSNDDRSAYYRVGTNTGGVVQSQKWVGGSWKSM